MTKRFELFELGNHENIRPTWWQDLLAKGQAQPEDVPSISLGWS